MRPWILLMRTIGVACVVLADDVLILADGSEMLTLFAKGLNHTHEYLQAMGARIAPDKSYDFASDPIAVNWLRKTWWVKIEQQIEVVKDFRYLGAHLSSGATVKSPTLCKRWDKAIQQLRRLKHCPASVEAKAKAIAAKTYASAFYGIEAASIAIAKINQLTAAAIDVFRSRNDKHNVDWFFSAFFEDQKDLDPIAQIFARRALQIRRTACKKPATKAQFQRILEMYVSQKSTTIGGISAHGGESQRHVKPKWYHDKVAAHGKPPQGFLPAQNRRGTDETTLHHDDGHEANGPVGLLIASIIWNGLKIDSDFIIWQSREEPIDLFQTPYQSLQPQLIQMAARARTIAEWNTAKPRARGLREFD